MKKTLTTRLKEYKAACRLAAFERSAVVEHAWQEDHESDVKGLMGKEGCILGWLPRPT